ncbi:MAG: TRAP transporter substrate-binding protein [Arenicella sp.]
MKNLLLLSLLISLLSVWTSPTMAAKKIYKWRIADSWPKDFPLFGDAVLKMINNAKTLSNGRLLITSESAEMHNRPLEIFNMVKSNEYEMGHTASYYWKDLDVNTLFFSTLPLGMITPEQQAWFYYGGGMELMKKVYDKHGLLSFPGGNTGNQMGGWFRKEIKSIADLKGVKMRITGLASDVIKTLGVQTINIPAFELYEALESGRIDALEWVGPSLDLSMGFHKIAPYYYTGWQEPATELQFIVNPEAYNKLPKDLQAVLKASMKLAAQDTYFEMYHASIVNLDRMRAKFPSIKIRSFPNEVIRALSRETSRQLEQLTHRGNPLTREIVDSISSYKSKARVWTRISDQAYLNNSGL